MYRDVTPRLAIDEGLSTASTPDRAAEIIGGGSIAVVGSAADAIATLRKLGATKDLAAWLVEETGPDSAPPVEFSLDDEFHLQGQHDQKSHGNRGGKAPDGAVIPGVGPVDEYLAANPQLPDEPIFVWHGRLVDGLPDDAKHALLFEVRERCEPVGYLLDGMKRWREMKGLPEPKVDMSEVPAPLEKGDAVARAFEQAADQAGDPRVQEAFAEFKRQSEEMYEFMTRPESEGGLGVTVEFWTDPNPANFGNGPYPNATAQAEDLRVNRRILLESGLGGAHEATMSRDEYDRFRAVHDVFGHAAIGTGFDRHGEYQAYLAHASMYYGDGHRAMASEYHGVNTSVWTGAPGSPGTGKSVLLPEVLISNPWNPDGSLAPLPSGESLAPYLQEVRDQLAALIASGHDLDADVLAGVRALADAAGIPNGFSQQYERFGLHSATSAAATKPQRGIRQFHLQGQHDQKSHGNRAGAGAVPDPDDDSWLDELPGYDRKRAAAAADRLNAAAVANEPAVTAHLLSVAQDADGPGVYHEPPPGQLFGYDYRFKKKDKIAEKIGRKMRDDNLTFDEAVEAQNDTLRYTIHYTEDEFGVEAQAAIDSLRSVHGPDSVRVKNTWPPEAGVAYKGVNAVITQRDGFKFEVQFHTPESQRVKDQMHTMYEEQRVLPQGSPRWLELEREMQNIGNGQPTPRDATRVFRVARTATLRAGGENR